MTVEELIQELQKFPAKMDVMCESNCAHLDGDSDTIFNAISVNKYDISTFGYEWSQHNVCRIVFNVL